MPGDEVGDGGMIGEQLVGQVDLEHEIGLVDLTVPWHGVLPGEFYHALATSGGFRQVQQLKMRSGDNLAIITLCLRPQIALITAFADAGLPVI